MGRKITFKNTSGAVVTLGNAAPYILQKLDVKTGVEIENYKGVRQDGKTYLRNTLDEMDISFHVAVVGSSQEDVENRKRVLQRAFNPKENEGIITYDNGIKTLETKAIVTEIPYFSRQNHKMALGIINLTAHQPFWLEPFYESREMSYIMGGLSFRLSLPTSFSNRGFRRMAINDGDVDTPVEIEFKGPAINPTVTNETTGEYVQVNRALGEEDVLNVSTAFGEKYVRINGENAFHYIDLQSTFWQLMPGENILSYTSNNDSINTRVTVKWKNRYIGL